MVSRHQAKAVVPTEPCGFTLEVGKALSGLLGLVIGGLDSSPAAAGACLYSAWPWVRAGHPPICGIARAGGIPPVAPYRHLW